MSVVELKIIKKQSKNLLPKQKLELIRYLTESTAFDRESPISAFLKFGKYSNSGHTPSVEEDFRIAEWHPTGAEMNGD